MAECVVDGHQYAHPARIGRHYTDRVVPDHRVRERAFDDPPGVLAYPGGEDARGAVLVLSGSSGRVEDERVRLLARHGLAAMSFRWFGGSGQPPGICEVALESFTAALDDLAGIGGTLAVIGSSKGAEAALLLASRDRRVGAVVGFSPSSVVWANVGPGPDGRVRPCRSSWTADGEPLPFVPYDDDWRRDPSDALPAYRGMYEQSLRTFAGHLAEAEIPVERIAGRVLVTAGGDDRVWPAEWFTRRIAERRAEHGLATTVLTDPGAGHRVLLPGETAPEASGIAMARGGSPEADARFGRRIWPALTDLLGLPRDGPPDPPEHVLGLPS
jgi:hypothetical protein